MNRLRHILLVVGCLAMGTACSGSSDSSPDASTPASAAGESSKSSDATDVVAPGDTVAGESPDSAESAAASAAPTTTPVEAVIDVSNQPGTGEFAGAREDVTDVTCEAADGNWRTAGKVTNPTDDPASYRIYVSYIDAAGETLALVESDVDAVEPAATLEWSTDFASTASGLECVLRVERSEP
jgi:hypothetical protein